MLLPLAGRAGKMGRREKKVEERKTRGLNKVPLSESLVADTDLRMESIKVVEIGCMPVSLASSGVIHQPGSMCMTKTNGSHEKKRQTDGHAYVRNNILFLRALA